MGKIDYRKYVGIGVIAAAVCLFLMKFDLLAAGLLSGVSAAAPLLLGCVIAYVLDILLKRIERFYFPESKSSLVLKTRRPVCVALSFVVLGAIVVLIMKLVVPELASSIRLVTAEIPPLAEAVRVWAVENSMELPAFQEMILDLDVNWQEMAKKTVDFLLAGAGGLFNSVVSLLSGVIGAAAQVLIGTIFAIYILLSKETLKTQGDKLLQAFLKPAARKKLYYVLGTLHSTFTSFIVGQCVEAVIIGVLCAAGMFVLRMPYAVMTGTVVGVTALIPVVGAYLGAAVGAFMVFTVNPMQAVGFVVFLVILQQLEGNLIYPKVVGSSIGLPGLWVLAAVTVGGGMFGVGGMLLGVPLAASVYRLLKDTVAKRLCSETPKQEEADLKSPKTGHEE